MPNAKNQHSTLRAERFAALIARGLSQTDAWIELNPRKRGLPRNVATDLASKFARRPAVSSRITAALRDAKIRDMDSEGQAHSDLLRVLAKAEAAENYTAYAALARCRSQHLGITKENLVIRQDHVPDSEIIRLLAGNDPVLQQRVKAMLGRSAFDPAPVDDDAAKTNERPS